MNSPRPPLPVLGVVFLLATLLGVWIARATYPVTPPAAAVVPVVKSPLRPPAPPPAPLSRAERARLEREKREMPLGYEPFDARFIMSPMAQVQLGLTDEQVAAVTRALADARQTITSAIAARTRRAPELDDPAKYGAAYFAPADPEKAAACRAELQRSLTAIVGETTSAIMTETAFSGWNMLTAGKVDLVFRTSSRANGQRSIQAQVHYPGSRNAGMSVMGASSFAARYSQTLTDAIAPVP